MHSNFIWGVYVTHHQQLPQRSRELRRRVKGSGGRRVNGAEGTWRKLEAAVEAAGSMQHAAGNRQQVTDGKWGSTEEVEGTWREDGGKEQMVGNEDTEGGIAAIE